MLLPNQTVRAAVGSNVTLACHHKLKSSDPLALRVCWIRLSTGRQIKTPVLKLDNIQPADAGIYFCRAQNIMTDESEIGPLVSVFVEPKREIG